MPVPPADPERVRRFTELNEQQDRRAARARLFWRIYVASSALLVGVGLALRARVFGEPWVAVGDHLLTAVIISAFLAIGLVLGC